MVMSSNRAAQQQLDPTLRSVESQDFQAALKSKVVGQEEGVRALVDLYQVFRAGMSSTGRPVGNLLFLGPTGSGKTRIVEAAAEILFGDPRAVIKVDCAEFQHSHEIAKLIGSPPGYLGHRETHPLLSQEVLNQYHTDKVKMGSILRPNLGFAAAETDRRAASGVADEGLNAKVSKAGVEAARRKFTPEFINRIDKVVVFRSLGSAELGRILTIELNQLQQRIFNSAGTTPFVFNVTPDARDFLLREGTD